MALYEELLADITHNFFYGGGFEVVTWASNGGFRKLPLVFALWVWDDAGDIQLVGPVFALQYSQSGVLGLRRFIRTTSGRWDQMIYKVGNFLVEPGAADFSSDAPIGPCWAVHSFIHRTEERGLRIIHKWGDNPSLEVRFENADIVPIVLDEFPAEFAAVRW